MPPSVTLPVLVIALAVLISGCQFFQPSLRGQIDGTVVNRKAGTAIEGTTVRVVELGQYSTTTDAAGAYSIDVPAGTWTLEFTQEGYAASRVEGVRVRDDETVRQDVIQANAFDPYVPAVAPSVAVTIEDGDAIVGDATTDLFAFHIDVAVADPQYTQPYFVTAALGQSRGTSGYLNQFVPGQIVGLGEASVTAELAATGFDGDTTLHVVAYDTNFNRTERIVHLSVESVVEGAAPIAPTGLDGNAITFGDTGVFGSLGVPPQVSGRQLVGALQGTDLAAFAPSSDPLPTAYSEVGTAGTLSSQDYLDEVVTWVDLYFDYTFATEADLPSGFEIFRSLDGGAFHSIGRVSPFQAWLGGTTFGYRDATPSLAAGVEATYRVDAVTGDARASSGTFATTPLGAFDVTADAPANGENFTSVLPSYEMSYSGVADDVYLGVLVFDRVQAEDNFLEWGLVGLPLAADGAAPGLAVTTTGATIPHNIEGSASTPDLQPFHAYDWTPIAVTYTSGFSAISIGADFYDFFGVGFGVSDGPWNTFFTGDGSF